MIHETCGSFCRAGQRIRYRFFFREVLSALKLYALPVFTIAVSAGVIFKYVSWGADLLTVPLVITGIGVWLVSSCTAAVIKTPGLDRSVALWDEAIGKNESLLSAYFFESRTHLELGEKVHLNRMNRNLSRLLSAVSTHIPIRYSVWHLIYPVLFVVLVCFGIAHLPVIEENTKLDREEVLIAEKEAEELLKNKLLLESLQGVSDKEEKEIEKLKVNLKDVSKWMKDLDGRTSREVLEQLDKQAREAERIAGMIKCADNDFSNSPMISELQKHTDTADLGASLKTMKEDEIAKESRLLSEHMKKEISSNEMFKRITRALQKSLEAGSASDRKSIAGMHFKRMLKMLTKNKRKGAADELMKMSRFYKQAAFRKETQRKLNMLAKRIRQTGRHILGKKNGMLRSAVKRNQSTFMKKLPYIAYRGQVKPGSTNKSPAGRVLIPGSKQAHRKNPFYSRIPGTRKPVPGTMTMNNRNQSGTGSIPIPGNMLAGNTGRGQAGGQQPGSGHMGLQSGAARAQAAQKGGLEAGQGSAPYTPKNTKPLKASKTGVVSAHIDESGESATVNIDPSQHKETSKQSFKKIAIESIREEEEAIAAEPIPLTRRDEVIRYFLLLRRCIKDE